MRLEETGRFGRWEGGWERRGGGELADIRGTWNEGWKMGERGRMGKGDVKARRGMTETVGLQIRKRNVGFLDWLL